MRVDQARPWTSSELADDLRRLGVGEGDVLIVHSSMRAVGFVVGGAEAVLDALRAAIGPTGTITMPAHTPDRSDPALWVAPPVPEHWWPVIREHMPVFDPYGTPPERMGALAEALLLRRDTLRSAHPQLSHMANGPAAAHVVAPHRLDEGLGDDSPLGRLYALDAKVVLIGVDHGNNTALHLAESRATWPGKQRERQGSRVLVDGVARWVAFEQTDYDADDFLMAGMAFETTGAVRAGRVGAAVARVMPMRALVDVAVDWFGRHRSAVRGRSEMVRMITAGDATAPDVGRPVVPGADTPLLADLMLAAYQGTVDDEGETLDDALAVMSALFAGDYGRFDADASTVFERDGVAAAATLVTHHEGWPLVAFSITRPAAARHGLARQGLVGALGHLARAGQNELHLVVTDRNLPAVTLYRSLGFTVVADR